METFANALKTADAFIWGPPLLILLLGTHLFYTFRLRFVQRYFGTAVKLITQKDDQINGNVAPFAALAVALASILNKILLLISLHVNEFSSVQSLSLVRLFVTP